MGNLWLHAWPTRTFLTLRISYFDIGLPRALFNATSEQRVTKVFHMHNLFALGEVDVIEAPSSRLNIRELERGGVPLCFESQMASLLNTPLGGQ